MKFWVSIVFFLSSVAYTVYGFVTLTMTTQDGKPGSGFFPVIIGICLIIFTAINVIREYKNKIANDNEEPSKPFIYIKEILGTIILLIIFTLMLRILGALISMILFVFAILYLFNREKRLQNIIISLVFPILLFTLFDSLNATLPKGFLGF